MTVIGENPVDDRRKDAPVEQRQQADGVGSDDKLTKVDDAEPENAFSGENLLKETQVPANDASRGSLIGLGGAPRQVVITAQDKVTFIDSIVNNDRFTRRYSIFGGNVTFTLRSLTSEEVQALSEWIVKHGTSSPDFQITGKYRKYLMSAQIAMYNGTEMPPLEQPLFETLESDGKTIRQPGWTARASFWDNKPSGLVEAILSCMRDFDALYSTLCKKAEDPNFWNPDTP